MKPVSENMFKKTTHVGNGKTLYCRVNSLELWTEMSNNNNYSHTLTPHIYNTQLHQFKTRLNDEIRMYNVNNIFIKLLWIVVGQK